MLIDHNRNWFGKKLLSKSVIITLPSENRAGVGG